jgi:O-Antigen ligase
MAVMLRAQPRLGVEASGDGEDGGGGDSRRLASGWPLAVAFIGYPVWWVLGVGEFVLLAAAGCMGYELLRRREIKTPRGFGWWILFLAWMVVGVLVLQVNAPGAVPGDSQSRYLVWGYRLLWFIAATVVLLYVGNTRRQLSARRMSEIMSWMFLVVVVGGLAGTVVPSLTFPSLLETVLPHGVSSIGFIGAQIHPTFAQSYDVQRPSAPFPYANEWGLNFACLLPFFVASWCHRDAGWRLIAAPFVLALAVIPVVYSLNRGLWLTLAVMAVFVAVRSAATGHVRLLGALCAGVLAVAVLLSVSPLKSTLESRVSQEDTSNQGRTNLVSLTLRSMTEKSPVVGLGSTRNVQGTFDSISGGATVLCPLCSPPAMGTQGLLWLVAFSTGVGGMVMFLAFFVLTFLRSLRLRSANATLGLSVLMALFVTLPIYDLSGPALFAVMTAIALLWRDAVGQQMPVGASRYLTTEPTLRAYGAFAVANRRLIAACLAIGFLLGAGWQATQGTPHVATVSLLVPGSTPAITLNAVDPTSGEPLAMMDTLDTDAQLASSPAVTAAIDRVDRSRGQESSRQLSISATANSRILHLSYTANDAVAAKTAVEAAENAFIHSNAFRLSVDRASILRSLQTRSEAVDQALALVARGVRGQSTLPSTRTLRTDLLAESALLATQTQQVTDTPLEPGQAISMTSVRAVRDGWWVSLTSGAMLGLLAGISLARLRTRRLAVGAIPTPSIRGASDIPSRL